MVDPFDAILDARSEALYTADPNAEPEQWEQDAQPFPIITHEIEGDRNA